MAGTYDTLVAAAPDAMADLVIKAGAAFGHDPAALSVFFASLGTSYELMKPAIRAALAASVAAKGGRV